MSGSDPHDFDTDRDNVGCEGSAGILTSNDRTLSPGQTVTVSGSGLTTRADADRRVRIFMLSHFELLTTVNQSGGRFSATVTIPASAQDGSHQLVAKGTGSSGPVALAVSVTVGAGGVSPEDLPTTGRRTRSGLMQAFVLVTAGELLIAGDLVVRRRRRA